MNGDLDEIVKLVEEEKVTEGLKKAGADVELLNDVAIHFQEKNPKVSIEFLNKILEKSDNAIAWYNKGVALDSLRHYKAAIKCYEKAIKLGLDLANSANAWKNKGSAFQDLGKHEEAIDCYEEAIAVNPNDRDGWYNKGYALYKLTRYEEAIDCYEEAIKINPEDKSAWNNKGIALSELGRYEEARDCYGKVLNIVPSDLNAHFNLITLVLKEGVSEEDFSKKDYWEWWQTNNFKKSIGLFLGILAIFSIIQALWIDLLINRTVSYFSVILIGFILTVLLFPQIRKIPTPWGDLEKEPEDHATNGKKMIKIEIH